jgi:hypothetical protein
MNLARNIIATVVGGFILAVLVSECREIKQTHDEVIRLEQKIGGK